MVHRLAAQEHLLEGNSLVEKYEFALSVGFHGVELLGRGDGEFAARSAEIAAARSAGVVMPATTVIMDHFIGDFDADKRKDAREQIKMILAGTVAAGGFGVVTPHAFGLFSRALPPFVPPRSVDDSRALLVESLRELADYAEPLGATVLLEPLNRFEDYVVNRLADAVSIAAEVDSPSLAVIADTFHMSIEEPSIGDSIRAAGGWIRHVQLGDSNRLEPGAGHFDWEEALGAFADIGYDGWYVMECGLSGPPREVLPGVADLFARGGKRIS
ncbi:sugar phosphate isomerase/epimerase family protein [Microbacterium insulae]|uniref:Sugar phosphate isomerase/epimerase family protein n=1 Tax=Microbacterium insulae TaxID=483014 RepID=A0ABW3AHA3_9MICO